MYSTRHCVRYVDISGSGTASTSPYILWKLDICSLIFDSADNTAAGITQIMPTCRFSSAIPMLTPGPCCDPGPKYLLKFLITCYMDFPLHSLLVARVAGVSHAQQRTGHDAWIFRLLRMPCMDCQQRGLLEVRYTQLLRHAYRQTESRAWLGRLHSLIDDSPQARIVHDGVPGPRVLDNQVGAYATGK